MKSAMAEVIALVRSLLTVASICPSVCSFVADRNYKTYKGFTHEFMFICRINSSKNKFLRSGLPLITDSFLHLKGLP